jgi:hypothetical protein
MFVDVKEALAIHILERRYHQHAIRVLVIGLKPDTAGQKVRLPSGHCAPLGLDKRLMACQVPGSEHGFIYTVRQGEAGMESLKIMLIS